MYGECYTDYVCDACVVVGQERTRPWGTDSFTTGIWTGCVSPMVKCRSPPIDLFLESCSLGGGVTSDLWMCVFSCRCRGNAAISRGRLWAGTCCGHEEESFLPFQTVGKTWGHFLFGKDQRHKHKGFPFICFAIAGLSAMIRGAEDGNSFVVRDYAEDDIEKILDEFFTNLPKMWQFWFLLANWELTGS